MVGLGSEHAGKNLSQKLFLAGFRKGLYKLNCQKVDKISKNLEYAPVSCLIYVHGV